MKNALIALRNQAISLNFPQKNIQGNCARAIIKLALKISRFFRVWHQPNPQIQIILRDSSEIRFISVFPRQGEVYNLSILLPLVPEFQHKSITGEREQLSFIYSPP